MIQSLIKWSINKIELNRIINFQQYYENVEKNFFIDYKNKNLEVNELENFNNAIFEIYRSISLIERNKLMSCFYYGVIAILKSFELSNLLIFCKSIIYESYDISMKLNLIERLSQICVFTYEILKINIDCFKNCISYKSDDNYSSSEDLSYNNFFSTLNNILDLYIQKNISVELLNSNKEKLNQLDIIYHANLKLYGFHQRLNNIKIESNRILKYEYIGKDINKENSLKEYLTEIENIITSTEKVIEARKDNLENSDILTNDCIIQYSTILLDIAENKKILQYLVQYSFLDKIINVK